MRKTILPLHRVSWCVVLSLSLVQCSPPPVDTANVCSVFNQQFSWYLAARKTQKKWKVPIATQMAIMRQESSFQSNARPPRKYYLGFIPGARPSSAFGYGQILDGTWNHYLVDQGYSSWRKARTSFSDVSDFMGWYLHHIHVKTGIGLNNAEHLYFAYHEGPNGYINNSYRSKRFLLNAAQRVRKNSSMYTAQLQSCEKKLKRKHPIALLFRG